MLAVVMELPLALRGIAARQAVALPKKIVARARTYSW